MPRGRRFAREFAVGMGLYVVLLVASLTAQVMWRPSGAFLFLLALAPMIGCVAVLVAVMRGIGQMDELERRVQFEAVAFAFVATALVTFGWGFLENAGAPKLPAFGVWPIMAVFWCAGTITATRRYR